ncbi:MAG: mycothiol synthase [Acidimicrobiia bacterium]
MPSTRVLREFPPHDVAQITHLAHEVEADSGIAPLDDDAWTGLHDTTGRDTGIAVTDGAGDLVAYAHLAQHHPGQWSVSLVVPPVEAARRSELLTAALRQIGGLGGGQVTVWFHGATAADDELARSLGLTPDRELRQLRVALPLPDPVRWPEGVTVRPFRIGADEDAWVRVNNRAFAGHPEQGAWTVDMLRAREAEEWFDPEGFLLAFDADGLAGSCWTKVHPPRPPHEPAALGEIYVIGADPSRHGTGLGRALTAGGLESLAARGITTGMLFVDGDNDAAVGLYTKLGFTTHRVDRSYTITLVLA